MVKDNVPTNTVVLVTGGFDPLHSGHVAYLQAARQLGDQLVVGVNSDEWLVRKKGRAFMNKDERTAVIAALAVVDHTVWFDDSDGSARDAIRKCQLMFPNHRIVFANGGDRTSNNIPEMTEHNVEFAFGVGGTHKMNSSSWILEEWRAPKTPRPWGYYRVLHEHGNSVKLKELTVEPGQRLSMQRHQQRAEHWFVCQGTASVYTVVYADNNDSTDIQLLNTYEQHQHVHIPRTQWHQLCNEHDTPLKLIEIQYGSQCIEEDIERV